MKLTCTDYAGWDAVVTELGAPTEIFYQGDASSTVTILVIAYYSAAPYNVVVFESPGGVLITTLLADYVAAVLVPGLSNVEI